jgi:hypothetical protein
MKLEDLKYEEWKAMLEYEWMVIMVNTQKEHVHNVTEEEYKEFEKWVDITWQALFTCERRLDRFRASGKIEFEL